jgi:hypothetical protein
MYPRGSRTVGTDACLESKIGTGIRPITRVTMGDGLIGADSGTGVTEVTG